MTPQQFIAKWKPADLKERAACQEHFLDLCAVLGEPTPAAADPTGTWFTFEKGVSKDTGGQGFADVWRRGFFGWEYKGKWKDLKDAYRQLCQYRESLLKPPLLVGCPVINGALNSTRDLLRDRVPPDLQYVSGNTPFFFCS